MTSTVVHTPMTCPVCLAITLVRHCDSMTCPWHRCTVKACDAQLDLARRRGHYREVAADGSVERPLWVAA